MGWYSVETKEYDIQAIMYLNIGTHHRLHSGDGNKPQYSWCVNVAYKLFGSEWGIDW